MADDLTKRLTDAGRALAPDRDVDPVPIAAAARRSHHRRRAARWSVLTVVALVGAGLTSARLLGSDDAAVDTASEGASSGGWERLPDPPLSPRSGSTAVWTGAEVVVVGGWELLCPPNADCGGPATPPFSDGAAYDPASQQWRTIAPAPVPLYGERGIAVDGSVYLLVSCEERVVEPPAEAPDACAGDDGVLMLVYEPAADEWSVLAPPPNDRDYELLAAGSYVVAYAGSDAHGEAPDWVFDTNAFTWQEIPDDPFPDSYDRTISTTDGGETLILIAAATGPSPPDTPNLVARLDVASGRWESLPSPPSRGYRGWGVDDVIVLEPHFGGEGGQLDPERGTWSELPPAPASEDWNNAVLGAVGEHDAVYAASAGWVADLAAQRWIEVSPPDDRETFPDSNITAVGRDLFLFGGERWEGSEGQLLGDAWLWRAPSTGGTDASQSTPEVAADERPGRVTIELIEAPLYIEGWDIAARITPDGGTAIEHGYEDFEIDNEPDWGGQPPVGGSYHLTVEVPTGPVAVLAALTIGPGGGPPEPDLDATSCSPVEFSVPPGGSATVHMDWETGCLVR